MNIFQSVTKMVTDAGGAIAGAALQTGEAVAGTTVAAGGAIGNAASLTGQAIVGTATGVGGAIGGAAVQASQAVVGTAVGTGEVVSSAAFQAGQTVAGTAFGVGGAIGGAAVQATKGVGYAIAFLGNNPQFQQATKALQVDWLVKLIDQVDIVKAETEVRTLQQQYPNEQPSEIAHCLMVDKALLAAGTGFASSLVPGAAAALFAVDLTATMLLQAEMVFQIACAYGLDLQDPARKGEVLAIFGLSLGGSQALKVGGSYAIKAGMGFLRNVPVAGAVIGASTNAAMIYALGYGACRFYEAKINPLTNDATLVASQTESDKYLEAAITQEVVMDQILVHVVLAGNPGKTWEQILPELQTLNLSPASLEVIAAHINSPSSIDALLDKINSDEAVPLKSPPPLETLLNQINRDFAVPLLAQCHKITQLDGVTTPEEAKVIETIAKKFGITLDSLEELHR